MGESLTDHQVELSLGECLLAVLDGVAPEVDRALQVLAAEDMARVTRSSAPRTFDGPDGSRLVIERAGASVDRQLVQFVELRFPSYRVVNLADWLEEH